MQRRNDRIPDLVTSPQGSVSRVFCRPELTWITSDLVHCRTTGTTTEFPYGPEFRDVLERWRRFQSIDDAALESLNFPNLGQLAIELHRRSKFYRAGQCLRILAKCLTFAHRRQLDLLASNAKYVHAQKILKEISESGLLISDETILQECRGSGLNGATAPPITVLGLVDDSHGDHILREAESYLGYLSAHGRKLEVIVSATANTGDSKRLRMLSLTRRYDLNVSYLDRFSRQALARSFEQQGIPIDVVTFALLGSDPKHCWAGAAKNALILSSFGTSILLPHSGTTCAPIRHPYLDPRLRLAQHGVTEHWAFRDGRRIPQSSQAEEANLIAAHERVLGRPVPQVVSNFANQGGVNFESACEHLLDTLWKGNGWIRATSNGSFGRVGAVRPEVACSIASFPPNHWLLNDRDRLEHAWAGVRILNAARSHTVLHHAPLGEQTLGVDLTDIVPPFMPVGADEQRAFLWTLFKCCPNSYLASVPWSLPIETHSDDDAFSTALVDPRRIGLSDLIIPCIASSQMAPHVPDPAVQIKALGEFLHEFGSLEAGEFDQQLQLRVGEHLEHEMCSLEDWINGCETQTFMVGMIRSWIDARRQAMCDSDFFHPSDLGVGSELSIRRRLAQESFSKFGTLLRWWPEMVAISKKLRLQDMNLNLTQSP
jgi:hypothetical protein